MSCVSILPAAALAAVCGAFPAKVNASDLRTLAGTGRVSQDRVIQIQMMQQRGPMMCGSRAEIVAQLGKKYGETRRSMGVTGRSGVMEVFASDETGSWTVLLTNPQGVTCLMAAGEAFESLPVEEVGSPA